MVSASLSCQTTNCHVRHDPFLQGRFVQKSTVPLQLAEGPCLLGNRFYSANTNDEDSLSAFLPWLDVLQLLVSASLC